ncbi:unnamed protein product [Symbiodinium natans]|uniref:SH3 domain-containing protein n=1 Tax=Symbiodinium natans TaxID=878477 RepID=A0A812KKG9_9DINO|nr:unnamed protein product [Symbiodinium natans]
MGLKRQPHYDDFRKLATEVLDLSLFTPERGRKFEADQESHITYCLLLSVLSSKRDLGLGVYWDEGPEDHISLIALAVEDAAVLLRTHDSGGWLPSQVKEVLSNPGVMKIHAGDGAELRAKLQASFGVDLRGELDVRTEAKAPQDVEAMLRNLPVGECCWSSADLPEETAAVAAKRALLCWKHAAELRAKAREMQPAAPERVWAEHCVVRRPDGLYCWACQAGPAATDADMEKHIAGAQHKRRLVLAGVLQDDQILPPVPASLAARGIAIDRGKDGALQYFCQKCNAGPFPTLDSVDSHLQGAKHLHKEGLEPTVQLTADLAKEGFVLSPAGDLECLRCHAGPFHDRQSLRLHRQSLQHRDVGETSSRPPRMEAELRDLPGYCNLLGNNFCCFLCDVSAASLDGILQHLAGKSHRKACQAHGEPEPLVLCKDLVCEQVSGVYPLQGRLRDGDLEPIFRKGAGAWLQAGPGAKKLQSAAPTTSSLPNSTRAMVAKEDVLPDGSDPDLLGASMGDSVLILEDQDAQSPWVWAEVDGRRGWFPRKALVKKLPPWKLSKVRSKSTVQAPSSDFDLPVVPPKTPLDWSDCLAAPTFRSTKDVAEALQRAVKTRGREQLASEHLGVFLLKRRAPHLLDVVLVSGTDDSTEQAVGEVRDWWSSFELLQEVAGAEHAAEEVSEESQKVVKVVENATLQVLPRVVNATEALLAKGTKSAHKEIKDVSDAAREGAVNVVKGLIKPNTLTTTIRPVEVPTPPASVPYRHFVSSAAAALGHSVLYWITPIVVDLLLISLAFVLFEIAMGIGRHSSTYLEEGLARTASSLMTDICSGWVCGASALVAFWVLGILLAQELRPLAEKIQEAPLHPIVSVVLGVVCMLSCMRYAVGAVNRTGSYRLLERDAVVESLHQDSKDSFAPLLDDLGLQKVQALQPAAAPDHWSFTRCLCAALAGIFGSLLAAVEGPLCTTAISTTYKAVLMSHWMWGFVPWGLLLPEVLGIRLPPEALIACVAVGAILLGACLHVLRQKSGQAAGGAHGKTTEERRAQAPSSES